MRDERVAVDDPESLSCGAKGSKTKKPRRRSSIGTQISNILAAVTKKQRRNSSLTMTRMAPDSKNMLSTSTSHRRVAFHPLVEMSFIASFQDMTTDEKRQMWISAEDKAASQRDMCISVLALRCFELGESTTEIRNRIYSVANETEAHICFRGLEHHKSKIAQKVSQAIKKEHVATILREQQAYRLETGRSRGTPSFLLANVSHRNSRYSRERAIKLARLDEEYVKQQLRLKDEAGAEEDRQQPCAGLDLVVGDEVNQASGQETNEKKMGHQIRNTPIENMKQKQSFPSCA